MCEMSKDKKVVVKLSECANTDLCDTCSRIWPDCDGVSQSIIADDIGRISACSGYLKAGDIDA